MTEPMTSDKDWPITDAHGHVPTWERVGIAVLMDIRRELRRLNAAMYGENFLAVPHHPRRIARNPEKRPAQKRKAT